MFAIIYLAYESLSEGMKDILRRLWAAHNAAKNFARHAQKAKQLEGTGLSNFKYSDAVE
jgi:alpha-ketoglutarate-dependent taurine dioxygenase